MVARCARGGHRQSQHTFQHTFQHGISIELILQRSHTSSAGGRCAAASRQPGSSSDAEALLSSIRKGRGLESLLMTPEQQAAAARAAAAGPDEEQDEPLPPPPNPPITPAAFVEALSMLAASSGHAADLNPAQLDEILQELLDAGTLPAFTPAQLVASAKHLATLCSQVSGRFAAALAGQVGRSMFDFDLAQLAVLGWASMRLVPMARPELREAWGVDAAWLEGYAAACEAQLRLALEQHEQDGRQQPQTQQQQQQQQQGMQAAAATAAAAGGPHQRQQQQQQQQGPAAPRQRGPPLPSAQQLANLLLIPAAVQQAPSPTLLALVERALLARQVSLCGHAVAQLLTTHVRLQLRPSPALMSALLDHLQEELLLYDCDELAQVAFGAHALALQLPDSLLADMTERGRVLEAAGAADEGDMQLLQGALERLAAARVAAAGPAAAVGA